MSRGYRISWPQPVWHNASTRVESSDAIAMDVAMLEILPEAEMNALLRQRLAADGWREGADGSMSRRFGEVDVVLAPDGRTVTATAKSAQDVNVRARERGELPGRLEEAAASAKRNQATEVSRRILEVEGEIREAVQGALQKVYGDALRRKAAAMGEVESVHEVVGEGGELELTIKVKV
ncbi:MAG: hypothetical protein R3B09_22290 [Nannocystaceae bacterium]